MSTENRDMGPSKMPIRNVNPKALYYVACVNTQWLDLQTAMLYGHELEDLNAYLRVVNANGISVRLFAAKSRLRRHHDDPE